MEERDFFDKRPAATQPHAHLPPLRTGGRLSARLARPPQEDGLPRHADERDRARFAKAQSYMVRRDDMVACKNIRCRKRFEVSRNPIRSLPAIRLRPSGSIKYASPHTTR